MSLFFSSLNLFALTLYIHRARKEAKSAQGASPWTPENGQRTPAYGLQSNPPPCLPWAVRSTIVCAERFLVRPLGTGSGGGGCADNLVFCSHLTPSGRFRPLLSWPYSVFLTAVGNESFGQWPAGQGEIETRRCSNPPPLGGGPVGVAGGGIPPTGDLPIAPQG